MNVYTLHGLRTNLHFDEQAPKNGETKEETTQSRREAIEKGIEDIDKGEVKEEKEVKKTKEEKETKEDSEDSEEDEDAVKLEQAEAVKLYRALNDPDTGPKILKILAEQAGLTKNATKEEIKETKKTLKDVIKEKLGTEYQFLAARLGEGLDEAISEIIDEKLNKVTERLDNKDRQSLADRLDESLNNCFGQYEDVPKAVKVRFNELIDEMPPNPKTDPGKYFNRLIKIAAEETNTTLKIKEGSSKSKDKDLTQSIKDKVNKNKADVTSRLASKGTEAEVDDTSRTVSSPKSRREAIERAAKEIDAKMKA